MTQRKRFTFSFNKTDFEYLRKVAERKDTTIAFELRQIIKQAKEKFEKQNEK